MAQPSREPEYISLAEAATRLGVHTRTIRRRVASGDLEAWRMGPRRIVVRVQDVDALLTPIPTAGDKAAS